MFQAILSYFWDNSKEDILLKEAYAVLESGEDEVGKEITPETLPNKSYTCSQKTGFITKAINKNYSIDHLYNFESDSIYAVGSKVSFVLTDDIEKECVSNVKEIDVAWSCEEEKESTWCIRSLICKVEKREGRNIFIAPSGISIDLNKTASEFVPITGDWLDIEAKCIIDEDVIDLSGSIIEIIKIRPLRTQIIDGFVKSFDQKAGWGKINQNIFFNYDSLFSGYLPIVKDHVVTEAIESDQGMCTWRALKIVPKNEKSKDMLLSNTNNNALRESDVVDLSCDINLKVSKFGEVIRFEMDVFNKSKEEITLLKVDCDSKGQNNIELLNSLCNIKIASNEKVTCQFSYKVMTVSSCRDVIYFIFNDFKIMRLISINFPQELQPIGNFSNSDKLQKARKYSKLSKRDFIKGESPLLPPRFVAHRLPDYHLPKKLLDYVLQFNLKGNDNVILTERLGIMKPCLSLPLSYTTYEDKFHTLLYLLEIKLLIDMRSYDQEKACFIKHSEYLVLEIENLAEKRPSVLIGDKIVACYNAGGKDIVYEGFIHKIGAKHVYIKFGQILHDTYDNEDFTIYIEQSRSVLRKMHQAIGLAMRYLGREFLFPSKVTSKPAQVSFSFDPYEDNEKIEFKPKLISNRKVSELLELNAEMRRRESNQNETSINCVKVDIMQELKQLNDHKSPPDDGNKNENASKLLLKTIEDDDPKKGIRRQTKKLKLEWYDKSLNYYQKETVRNILLGSARPLPYIIFGPPGTGKTVTIIETILQLLRMLPHSRLLVTAPSNSAADLIALRLIDSGVLKPGDMIRFVAFRYVQENNIPLKLVPYCATANIAREGTTSQPITLRNGITIGCGSSVIGRHRITVSTCVASGALFLMGLPRGHFTHIIVDEAGQAMEPEIMIPLSFIDIANGQAVLAGDPMQLGPIVPSIQAMHYGLEESFLERILNRFPYVKDIQGFPETAGYDPRLVTQLVYNYRSLPEILEISNQLFYNCELKPTLSITESKEAKFLLKLQEILPKRENKPAPAVVFHGINGENYQTVDCPSWYNPDEASQIFDYVNNLYRLGVQSKEIGIITPYVKQVKQIRSVLIQAEFDVPKIGTVEEFQGQEFKVILLSTVRSNASYVKNDLKYSIGFVASPRRLNVSLTRAHVLTIIVGNPYLLSTDIYWRTVLNYCIKNDSYYGCQLPDFKQ